MGCAWGPRPAEGMSAAVSCSLCEGWGPCPWEAPVDVRMRPAHSQVRPASVGTLRLDGAWWAVQSALWGVSQ